ncbi:RagB/SusD family nutrient uptake outer membrane protein [Algibacter sp. Ld11]|uniref:RagB/SusD family nutrient uptake outer membrane protein n=1 Tax=Algibacter sp. Ld11 TaxID=649150 RepID=UPI0038645BEC
MKIINLKYYILIFVVGLMTSCDDNQFLQEINPNEISKANFWKDLSDTGAGLNATYKTLHGHTLLLKNQEILRSDMGYPGYGRPIPNRVENFHLHTYTQSSDETSDKWRTNYLGIFRANQVIKALLNLEGTVDDEAEWKSQMAQARFFRGLFHYFLYTTYNGGSIILRDKVPVTKDEFAKGLSPAADVLAFVREDLEYAYANLYKKGEYPDGDLSRVTSGAAGTILGSSYLQELNYSKAMTYFDDVINNHGYELEYDMSKLFTTAGEFNNESIFEINFTSDNIDVSLAPWDGASGTNWLNQLTSNSVKGAAFAPAWAVSAYKNEPMDPLDSRNYYPHPITGVQALRNVPLRASAMIAIVDDYQTLYYEEPTTIYNKFHGTAWGFGYWKHHTNHDIYASESLLPDGTAFSSKNITINRLADVILMQAECKIKTGQVDDALDLINDIRKRWGLVLLGSAGSDLGHSYDDEVYTAQSLMQHLMRVEKPLETSIEGNNIRFLDLLRWKKSEGYGLKERLTELSNTTFYAVHFQYLDSEGALKWKFNFPSIETEEPTSGLFKVIDYEFDISAENYDETKNEYYLIPQSEINTNTGLN